MLRFIIIAALVLPFIDLYILVELVERYGFLNILALILVTGLIGAEIVRREGRQLIQKIQRSVTVKEVSRNMLEGILLAVGGLMLLTPGIVTDVIGFVVVVRPTRERIMVYLAERLEKSANFEVQVSRF